ncbi:MAG: PDZ domain-containing protein, partial [Thermoguttaceae bacterium]|nr:PDZ domain-containing protein [Thermoguttaceae bacterium]
MTVELNGLPLPKPVEVDPVEVADLGVTLKGQEITDVVADSPADQAGLKVGDKIATCDDAAIETGEDLQKALEAKPESATLGVVKKSDDEKTDVVVNFKKDPVPTPVADDPVEVADLGVTLKGPEITKVVAGSPAANAGLEVGDKLVAYNGAPIQTGADVQSALDPKQFGAPVTVLKKSGGSEPTDLVVPFYRPGKPMFGATVQGQKITNVVPDSPAAIAGLEVGDQMIAFNGATIKNALDYEKAVDASPFHAQVVVLKTSTGQQVAVDVYLNRDPNGKPIPVPDVKGPVFGATVKGQELIAVVANSPAANAGLQAGDKILSFNGATINNAIDYEKAVDASPVTANLVVLKKGSAQQPNVSVRLNKTETTPPVPAKVDPPTPAQPTPTDTTVDQTPARFGALFNGQAITKIVPGSPADKAGLKVGEKIVILNGETVQTAQ